MSSGSVAVMRCQSTEALGSRGTMAGSIGLSGILTKADSMAGRAKFDITNLSLAKRSIGGKVVTALQLNDPTDFMFSDVNIDSYIKKESLFFEDFTLSGHAIVLNGQGSLNLKNNNINLNMTAAGSELTDTPSFIESLVRGLGPAMVNVKVSGKLDDPKIQTTTLPILQGPFDLFGIE